MAERKITWLSVLQGWAILLVLVGHVQLIDRSTGANHVVCETLSNVVYAFHMPLFVFISGGLLYQTRISRHWNAARLYLDKTLRLLLPFVTVTTLGFMLKYLANGFVKHPVDFSMESYLLSFVDFMHSPVQEMWFLATLFTLMLLYPVYLLAERHSVAMLLLISVSVVVYFIDFTKGLMVNYFNLFNLNRYLVYFVLGMLFFKHQAWKYLNGGLPLGACWLFFGVGYWLSVPLITALSGILGSVLLCRMLSVRWPNLFCHFRDDVFQIYIFGIAFQAFVELVVWKRLYCEPLLPLFFVLNVLAGLFGGVLMSRLIGRCPWRVVRLCFGKR